MKVIVDGAAAAMLTAAYELTRKGVDVVMLEAENQIGGRIQTLTPTGFVHDAETALQSGR